MTCPAFASSSEVSLWYAADPDPSVSLPSGESPSEAFSWHRVPMTGESLTATPSAAVSEQITPIRAYTGSKRTQIEVSGGFNYECQAAEFIYNALVCALQADVDLHFPPGSVTGIETVQASITAPGAAARTISLVGLVPDAYTIYSVFIGGEEIACRAFSSDLPAIAASIVEAINASATYTASSTGSLIEILGADTKEILLFAYLPGEFYPGRTIRNGSSRKCLAVLKTIRKSDGTTDYFVFRGMQVSSLSAEISASLITGSIGLVGMRVQSPTEAGILPAYWSFIEPSRSELMSGSDSLKDFYVIDNGEDSGILMQSLSIAIDNQLRQQYAVSTASAFSAGTASGRFKLTYAGPGYYSNPKIYSALVGDHSLEISGKLVDSAGRGFAFSSSSVRVSQGGLPMAESAEQDLLIQTEFMALESADSGTVALTRLPERFGSDYEGILLELQDPTDLLYYWSLRAP